MNGELFRKGTEINKMLGTGLILLKECKFPISKILTKHVESGKISLMYDDNFKRQPIRFELANSGKMVYCNVSNYAKKREDLSGVYYDMQIRDLYGFCIGGLAKLYFKDIAYNRDTFGHCMKVYIEFVRKAVLKNNHMSSQASRNKLDFILAYHILHCTKDKVVRNELNYAQKMSNITEEDLKMLMVKYPEIENNKPYDGDLFELLQKEFIFLKNSTKDTLNYNLLYLYGPANGEMLDDLSVIATIIVDFSVHNKATLNGEKNNMMKDAIEARMYNDIIDVLREV